MKQLSSLAYLEDKGPRHHGDLFIPGGPPEARILMLVHGGGWQSLSSSSMHGFARTIARDCGINVWTPGYRLLKHSPWPACLDDLEAAANWVLETRSIPLPDPRRRRLALAGFSAGGHLALMLGLARLPKKTECIISGAGPSLIQEGLYSHGRELFTKTFMKAFFGKTPAPSMRQAASPLCRIQPERQPPVLLIHNKNDHLVPVFHSLAFARRYRRKGNRCVCRIFEGTAPSHGFTIPDKTHALDKRLPVPEVRKAIKAFLGNHFY